MTLKNSEQETISIYFGEKPTIDIALDGSWNPAYQYKKKLNRLPYQPVLKIISNKENDKITDIDIVFSPNVWKYPKNTAPLITPPYNWINPYFWIDNGFYPAGDMRLEDEWLYINRNSKEYLKKPPLEEDFEIIFGDIWKVCVLKEGKASISQLDFLGYIWLLRYLIENSVIFPLKTIDYACWERYVCQYLEEAVSRPIFENNSENILRGWRIIEKDNAEKIKTTFLTDIKKILNLFFEKIKPNDGLSMFLHKIYKSYADELINEKWFIRCPYCGLLTDYLKGKKYCSLISEGKNCGKSARNQRFYSHHRERILPKAKKYSKEYRKYQP